MSDTNPPLSFAVWLGSVRGDRMGIRAAPLVMQALAARGHAAHWVDPRAWSISNHKLRRQCTPTQKELA